MKIMTIISLQGKAAGMKLCNFGSINVDHVYTLSHFVRPGETAKTTSYAVYPGGKGLNQSIALARSGVTVHHAGALGKNETWLLDLMKREAISTEHVFLRDEPSGHAVIQVIPSGENSIFIHGGANTSFLETEVSSIMDNFGEGDILLLQNEINALPYIMDCAARRKMKIVFNPAPISESIETYPLALVDSFILNEVEGEALSGQRNPAMILRSLRERYPNASVALTLGAKGVLYADGRHDMIHVPAFDVATVDTTAAGDTFIGYFLGSMLQNLPVRESLTTACKASALCVTKRGAVDSIPVKPELDRHAFTPGEQP
jgi:ribokinase